MPRKDYHNISRAANFFMSNVFDLRPKIILLMEVFLLSSKYSLVLSSSTNISFVFERTEFSKTNCLNAEYLTAFLMWFYHWVLEYLISMLSSNGILRSSRSFLTRL